MMRMMSSPNMKRLAKNLRFTETEEGCASIWSMVGLLDVRARHQPPDTRCRADAAQKWEDVIQAVPNGVKVRGHTDSFPWAKDKGMNNWRLSAERAEITRQFLTHSGVDQDRFQRIEGVADREPL